VLSFFKFRTAPRGFCCVLATAWGTHFSALERVLAREVLASIGLIDSLLTSWFCTLLKARTALELKRNKGNHPPQNTHTHTHTHTHTNRGTNAHSLVFCGTQGGLNCFSLGPSLCFPPRAHGPGQSSAVCALLCLRGAFHHWGVSGAGCRVRQEIRPSAIMF
jgi:hypothetical protein